MRNLTTLNQLQRRRDQELRDGENQQAAFTAAAIEGLLLGTVEVLEEDNALLLDIIRDLRARIDELEAQP